MSSTKKEIIIDTALENAKDKMLKFFETARSMRKNIIKARPLKFDGSFENYSAHEMLQTSINWTIAGPRIELETEKSDILIKQQIILQY